MKNHFKKALRLIIFLLFIFFTLGGLYTLYLFSNYNQDIDQEKIKQIITEVKKAKPQDEKLVELYNKLNDNTLEKSTWRYIWDAFMWNTPYQCPCFVVARSSYINKRHRIAENDVVIAVNIEKKTSQRECLNFNFENFNFLYGNIGTEQAAQFYFNKSVSELNEDELIGLLALYKNPAFFNPKRNREIFEKKVVKLKEASR